MNFKAILHLEDSVYCYALDERTVRVMLRVDSEDVFEKITLVYGNKYDYYLVQESEEMQKAFSCSSYDYYTATVRLKDVRFVYVFRLVCGGKTYYFSEDGVSEFYDFSLAYYNSFQLPFLTRADIMPVVPWFTGAVFYEIFVERFKMGDEGKDTSYIDLPWGEIPGPKSFAGGDLTGIIQKLDYLKSLGISALYLTPVFPSISNHKYDISNYYEIDPRFGDKETFRTLVNEAHARGIRIVLDAVFNHCSDRFPAFQDVVKRGKASPYFDWFLVHGDKIEGENYEYFGVCSYMPKLNTSNREVRKYLIDAALYWMKEFGIDGWRLDVSDEVSHDFWRHFREAVKEQNPDGIILGENWHDSYPYLRGDQFDGIMNYALTKACIDYFAKGILDAEGFQKRLSELYVRNTEQVNRMMLNLLDSHDTHRFYTLAGKDADKLICALAVIYLHTGAPCVYYGTEVPLEGGYDPDCRRCMDWRVEKTPTKVMYMMRALSRLRAREEIVKGDISFGAEGELFLLERRSKARLRLTVRCGTGRTPYVPKGEVLLSHNFGGDCLLGTGFVIEEIKEDRNG